MSLFLANRIVSHFSHLGTMDKSAMLCNVWRWTKLARRACQWRKWFSYDILARPASLVLVYWAFGQVPPYVLTLRSSNFCVPTFGHIFCNSPGVTTLRLFIRIFENKNFSPTVPLCRACLWYHIQLNSGLLIGQRNNKQNFKCLYLSSDHMRPVQTTTADLRFSRTSHWRLKLFTKGHK